MVDSLTLDERAHEDGAEEVGWGASRRKAGHVHASLVAEEFGSGYARREKRLFSLLGQTEDQVSKVILLEDLLPRDQETVFPSLPSAGGRPFPLTFRERKWFFLSLVPMPG